MSLPDPPFSVSLPPPPDRRSTVWRSPARVNARQAAFPDKLTSKRGGPSLPDRSRLGKPVGRLDEHPVAFCSRRQRLAGTGTAAERNIGIGRPHRPVAAADADAELGREVVRQHRLELYAVAVAPLRRQDVAKDVIVR